MKSEDNGVRTENYTTCDNSGTFRRDREVPDRICMHFVERVCECVSACVCAHVSVCVCTHECMFSLL